MLPKEVLEDIYWPLTRRDLEALLLTDHSCSGIVTDKFASAGPLRIISHAKLNDDCLKCQSGGEEKVTDNAKDYGLCLRNTIVCQLSFGCNKELSAEAAESLKAVKEKYLLKNLKLCGMTTGAFTVLKNDVFTCEELSLDFDYYDPCDDEYEEAEPDESEEDGNIAKEEVNANEEADHAGMGSDGDEESKEMPENKLSPEEVTSAFFNSNTVKKARCLTLKEMPPCDVELIAEWLHGGSGQPRSMNIWWDCNGEEELDSLKLIKIVKERFMKATVPQQYEFYAGAERFDASGIGNTYLENSCGEFLQIEPIRTCYSEVRITRLPAEGAQRLQIVPTLEGPKVWDFHSVDKLDRYLAKNSLMDLLARSGLIANQVQCKCGHPMHLRQKSLFQPEVAVADRFEWRCSGSCYNMYGQRFIATVRAGSWFKEAFWRWYWAELDFLVKLVILVASGADKQEIVRALYVKESFVEENGGLSTFEEKYNAIWGDDKDRHDGKNVAEVIKLFYEKVRQLYPLHGTYQLPEKHSEW